MTQEELFKKLVAHSKEYGFIFPSSEIYDGLSAVYDYGQLGVELKNNIKRYWWDAMTKLNDNIVGIDSAIFMHPRIWEASGHVGAFNDPLIDNRDSKKRYRADVLIEDFRSPSRTKRSPRRSRRLARSSAIRSTRPSFWRPIPAWPSTRPSATKLHERMVQGPQRQRPRRAAADHRRRAASSARSRARATGPRCASST